MKPMLKTSKYAFLSLILLSSQLYAQQVSLNLMPKVSKVVTNHYGWTLLANCTIHATQPKSKIVVSVLRNNGSVNGRNLTNGHATSVVVRNNDNISVSAEPGATVNILNLGTDSVQATCST